MKKKKIQQLAFLLFILFACSVFSQTKDSVSVKQSQKTEVLKHSPKKAALLSTILPGAGQFYNRKYWKPPVFYAAFAGLGYLIVYNNDRYQMYKQAYIYSTDGDANTINPYSSKYSDDNLLTLKNAYQRSRDLCIIGTAAVYVLNIVDAAVDAHMFTYDVSDNLSLRTTPSFNCTANEKIITGITISVTF